MKFIKTTIVGGVLFLVPLVVLVMVVSKAFDLMLMVANPVAEILPIDTIAGVALVNILAGLIVVLLCFLAGLLARTGPAERLIERIDKLLIQAIPGYSMVRGVAANLSPEQYTSLHSVIVRLEDRQRLGLEIERDAAGRVAVYLPGAPNFWSGTIEFFDASRVEGTDLNLTELLDISEGFGAGSLTMVGRVSKQASTGEH